MLSKGGLVSLDEAWAQEEKAVSKSVRPTRKGGQVTKSQWQEIRRPVTATHVATLGCYSEIHLFE